MRLKTSACALLSLLLWVPDADAGLELVTRRDPSFPPSDTAGGSGGASISTDGRYVPFVSSTLNLIPGQEDGNELATGDVFLRDTVAGTTILVSRSASSPNRTGNRGSLSPVISADGRYVAFASAATDLIPGQTEGNAENDVFLYDRITGTTTLVSRSHTSASQTAVRGSSVCAISADGGVVLFTSEADDLVPGQVNPFAGNHTFLYDRGAGTVALVSHIPGSPATAANGASPLFRPPVLSADGRFAAFASRATDLVSGVTDTLGVDDAFLYDRTTGIVTLLSRSALAPTSTADWETWPESISADGDLIALVTVASDLGPGVNDANNRPDVFMYRRSTASMSLVSRTSSSATTTGEGSSFSPRISDDGSRIAFQSEAMDMIPGGVSTLFYQIFLYDVPTGAMTLVSRSSSSAIRGGHFESFQPRINGNGSRVAFVSDAIDLLPGQLSPAFPPDVFLYDAGSGSLTLVSRSPASPVEGVGAGGSIALSAGGGEVAFSTLSGALDSDVSDTDKTTDVFLYSAAAGSIAAVSVRDPDLPSVTSPNWSAMSQVSANGKFLAFVSDGDQLLPGQVNVDDEDASGQSPRGFVFLYDRQLGTTTLVSHAAGSPVQPANAMAGGASMSAAGNYVLFQSAASDVVSGAADTNGAEDLFLWQRTTGTTTLLSHAAGAPGTAADHGAILGSLSADARYVTLISSSSDLIPGFTGAGGPFDHNAYLIDRTAGTVTLITGLEGSSTQGTSRTNSAVLNAGGRYVVLESYAANLIPGQQDTPIVSSDVFIWDRVTGTMQLVSHAAGSATQTGQLSSSTASLSADGRYIAFQSHAPDLVSGFVPNGVNRPDIYLQDRATGLTQLVSRKTASPTAGASGFLPRISDDGRFVVFLSSGSDLVPGQIGPAGYLPQAYLFDRLSGTMTLVSHAAGSSVTTASTGAAGAEISADSRFISFSSAATDLVPGQAGPTAGTSNAFVYDRVTGATRLISGAGGSSTQAGNFSSGALLFSADGSVAAFTSGASDLVEADYLGNLDIFLSTTPAAGTDFYTAVPCRVLDTRNGPAPVSDQPRLVTVAGTCGIPASARAVAVNVTAVQPAGNGNLAAYPGYLESTGTSTVSFQAGAVRASSAILPLALNGTGTLTLTPSVAGGGAVHLILDVSGWFE